MPAGAAGVSPDMDFFCPHCLAKLSQKGAIFSHMCTRIGRITRHMTKRIIWGWGEGGTEIVCFQISLILLFWWVQIPLGKTGSEGLEPQLHFLKCRNGSEVRKTWVVMVQSLRMAKLTLLTPTENVWGWVLAAFAMAESQGRHRIVTAWQPLAAVFCSHTNAVVPCVVPTNTLLLIFL